jgi:predicted O-linked N-acetylglucosamine transferase (SPINDLY family)
MANAALQNLFTLFQAGRYAEMVSEARNLLYRHPDEGALWKALSVGQQMLGEDALDALTRARALLPGDAELAANLGALWMARKDWPQAHAALQDAVRLQPRLAGAHNNLGNVLMAMGRHDEALAAFDTALALQPSLVVALGNRGRALLALGQPQAAAAAFLSAAAARPADVGLRVHAATALRAAGREADAVQRLREAVALAPGRVDAGFTLGELLLGQGDVAGAVAAWAQVLAQDPAHAEAACNLSQVAPERGETLLRSVLAAGVSGERRAAVLGNLGSLLLKDDRLGEAITAFREAVAVAPASPQAHSNLAQALRRQGRLDEADAVLSGLIEREPSWLAARSDRLLLRSYRQQSTPDAAALRAEAAAFGAQVKAAPVVRGVRPAGGLRVGLVSADLRRHPVGRLAQAWLPALARQCELVVYGNVRAPDALTDQLSGHVAQWHDITAWDDDTAARRIAADGIDVLVDLSGHTGGQRLGVFARRPAARQFSWLGYAGSTGLAEMDGFIGDRWLLPPEAQAGFVEPLVRLPHSFTVMAPPEGAPDVAPLGLQPWFGSFNGLHKLSDGVLALWSRVLAATPGSRLLIKAPGLQHAAEREALLKRWPGDVSRLALEGPGTLAEYLHAFSRVDVALDPSPYSGGMTTLDGLWMGVPVLTLPGAAPISRQGLSFLQTLGLAGDWVALDEDDFVGRAVQRMHDREGLAALRAGLRRRLLDSPLCDAETFARHWLAAVTG